MDIRLSVCKFSAYGFIDGSGYDDDWQYDGITLRLYDNMIIKNSYEGNLSFDEIAAAFLMNQLPIASGVFNWNIILLKFESIRLSDPNLGVYISYVT